MESTILTGPLPRIRWAPVIAGALCALAIQIVLGLFGTAMGISAGPSGSNEIGILGAIWSILTPAFASLVGAHVATRLASALHPAGAYLHGVLVWCIGLIAGAVFLTGVLTGGAIGGGRAVSGNLRRDDGAFQQPRAEQIGKSAAGASALAGLAALFGLAGALIGSISGRRAVLGDGDIRQKWLPRAVKLEPVEAAGRESSGKVPSALGTDSEQPETRH
ncbi:MAG TPA: hypothetical protein VE620_12410 [Myxococcales bacterium]|jgi:hypothetical protein|nr:hypothetical protein [Myxococcales bacterium]